MQILDTVFKMYLYTDNTYLSVSTDIADAVHD